MTERVTPGRRDFYHINGWEKTPFNPDNNPGMDTVEGGRGDDTIVADDDHEDVINCGKGQDEVTYGGGLDTVANCKTKHPK